MAATQIYKIFKYASGLIWNPITESTMQADSIEAALAKTPADCVDAADRDSRFGTSGIVEGSTCYRQDKKWVERYHAAFDSSTNPLGPKLAGWYPIDGILPAVICQGNTAAATLTAGGTTPLLFSQTTVLRNMTYNLATGAVTITQSGIYRFAATARFTAGTDNRVYMNVNGNNLAIGGTDTLLGQNAVGEIYLAAGDIVIPQAYSGTAQTLQNSTRLFSLVYSGPA